MGRLRRWWWRRRRRRQELLDVRVPLVAARPRRRTVPPRPVPRPGATGGDRPVIDLVEEDARRERG